MSVVSTAPLLKQLREELTSPRVSQETLARRANVTLATYRNAEYGRTCKYSTAMAIFRALNEERLSRNLPPIDRMEELGLSLE